MFGANFAEHFGIPNLDFPLQGADVQGGLFGPNAPAQALVGSQPLGPQSTEPSPQSPSAGVSATAPQPQPQPASPMASPLQPGAAPQQPGMQPQTPQQQPAPIAGQGSPLGAPPL